MALDWKRLIQKRPGDYPDSTGLGPDVPGERRYNERPSQYPRLLTVAVVDDNGKPIGTALIPAFDDVVEAINNLRRAMVREGTAADLGDLEY